MIGRRAAIGALCAGLAAAPSRAQSGRLAASLEEFRRQATRRQFEQVNGAIAASPALAGQLAAAADAGRLRGLWVAYPNHPPKGPFQATIVDSWIVFTADFLPPLAPQRMEHAHPDDIAPDNLVFVLGAFAFFLMNPPGPRPATKEAFLQAAAERNACAFLSGWNDVVDWATHGNRDMPLSVEQASLLMLNLRYRQVFMDEYAIKFRKLDWSPGGRLELNVHNVAAVAEGLHKMTLLDFGVPPLS